MLQGLKKLEPKFNSIPNITFTTHCTLNSQQLTSTSYSVDSTHN